MECTWYVEPKDSHTNKVISGMPEMDSENFYEGILCSDGKKHDFWQCSYRALDALIESRNDLGLKFNIWGKEGRGKIYPKNFLFFVRSKKPKIHHTIK